MVEALERRKEHSRASIAFDRLLPERSGYCHIFLGSKLRHELVKLKDKSNVAVTKVRLLIRASLWISIPLMRTIPLSGRSSELIIWSKVVFPAPLAPTIPTISPRRTSKDALMIS